MGPAPAGANQSQTVRVFEGERWIVNHAGSIVQNSFMMQGSKSCCCLKLKFFRRSSAEKQILLSLADARASGTLFNSKLRATESCRNIENLPETNFSGRLLEYGAKAQHLPVQAFIPFPRQKNRRTGDRCLPVQRRRWPARRTTQPCILCG